VAQFVSFVCRGPNSGDKSFWTRIGLAWEHKDAKGFNANLDCLPVDGKITLRVASESNS